MAERADAAVTNYWSLTGAIHDVKYLTKRLTSEMTINNRSSRAGTSFNIGGRVQFDGEIVTHSHNRSVWL